MGSIDGEPEVMVMRVSVLIPSYGRPAKLGACLRALARQELEGEFEVLVGMDGGAGTDGGGEVEIPAGLRVRVELFEKVGLIAVRRALLERAAGRWAVSLNDDVYAKPGLLAVHAAAHEEAEARGASVVVAGEAEWKPIESPSLFDELVQKTGLVFFPAPAGKEPGFRDCYGLNMSVPTELARRVGGFPDLREAYGYDDLELAYRLIERGGARLVRLGEACVVHDHRLTPDDVLRREYLLGRAAWWYAGINPSFGLAVFGRDIRTAEEVAYAEAWVRREKRDAARIEAKFVGLAELPAGASREMLMTLADSWLLLKRYLWRWGLLSAARGEGAAWARLNVA